MQRSRTHAVPLAPDAAAELSLGVGLADSPRRRPRTPFRRPADRFATPLHRDRGTVAAVPAP